MIFFKKSFALTFIASIFVAPSTHAMFPRFKKAFNIACKGANLGITFLPAWKYVANIYESKEALENTMPFARQETTDFVQAQLKAVGVRRCHPVRLLPDYADTKAATDGKNVYVNRELEALLKSSKENKERAQQLNVHKAIIQHEATHIKNNDQRNKEELIAYAPFITHAGAFALRKVALARKARHACPTIARSLMNIPGAFVKLAVQFELVSRYIKYTEQRADDGISNDLDILKAAQSEFIKYETEESQSIKNFLQANNIQPTPQTIAILKRINSPFHPSHEIRAAQFQKRIEQLTQNT